jgi:hypothetical protein
MADIFISWSQDDGEVVKPVVARLRAYGWSLYFSGDNAEAGRIDENVAAAIEGSTAMVLFVSPRTNQKPWLIRESEWAAFVQARQRGAGRKILKLIPVLIGDVSVERLNYFLAQDKMTLRVPISEPVPVAPGQAFAGNSGGTLQVSDAAFSEAGLRDLVTRIHNAIDLPPPTAIPTVLLARNLEQAAHHFDIAEHQITLNGLCKPMGMATFPDLRQELLKRYGATPDDFCPFEEKKPIKDLLETARQSLNEGLPEGSSPLELWWCRDEFFGANPDTKFARQQIASGPLLIVLDSISAQNSDVLANYNTVAAAHLSGPSALLWVPPYTGHTKRLRSLWSGILDPAPGLLARLETWGASPSEPQVLFDIGTAESLRAWSFSTLRTLGAQARSGSSRQQRLKNPATGDQALLTIR